LRKRQSAFDKEREMEVKEIICEIKQKLDQAGGLKHVFFVACGGSKAAIFPGLYLLQSEAKTFGATTYTSNEFVHALPKELDARCIAVICSLKATPETVEAVKAANAAGAITIAMTGSMETGMAKVGQYVVTYSNGDEQVYSDSNQANSLRIGFELLHQIEGWDKYDKAMEAYRYIDEIVAESKRDCLKTARKWAEKEKDEPIFYVLASGPNYGVAYSMCCCHFMEMQWKHAVCLHTGEYFHGPFETTDKALPMVLIMSEGRTRALDERCLKFLKTYAENYIVIDFKELNKGRIHESVAEFFNPVVLVPLERYYVSQMAELRGHSMDDRRYMWKVEY
jgi:fructoselysine 6-phosphate deglycase